MPRKTRSTCSCGFDFTTEKNRHRRVCGDCGTKRVPKTKAKHNDALKRPLEVFVDANGGYPGCWVCRHLGIEMGGQLQRDHDHKTGEPRGVLCVFHNRKLGAVYTRELILAYAAYLDRPSAAVAYLERSAA